MGGDQDGVEITEEGIDIPYPYRNRTPEEMRAGLQGFNLKEAEGQILSGDEYLHRAQFIRELDLPGKTIFEIEELAREGVRGNHTPETVAAMQSELASDYMHGLATLDAKDKLIGGFMHPTSEDIKAVERRSVRFEELKSAIQKTTQPPTVV